MGEVRCMADAKAKLKSALAFMEWARPKGSPDSQVETSLRAVLEWIDEEFARGSTDAARPAEPDWFRVVCVPADAEVTMFIRGGDLPRGI